MKSTIKSSFRRSIKRQVSVLHYLTGQFKNPIWLIGEGRSGTTWVSSIINFENRYKEIFEPFHPSFGPTSNVMAPHQYLRPGDGCSFEAIADRVFRGGYVSDRSEGGYIRGRSELGPIRWNYRGLLIKDIFANLFSRWAWERYRGLRIILLIRNPFAVALSKFKKKDWYWNTDPKNFLKQDNLMSDHLEPFREIIAGCGDDYIERQVLIWAIANWVPLQQFSRNQLYVLFYENLFESPQTEITNLFKFLHGTEGKRHVSYAMERIEKLSHSAGPESMLNSGKSPVSGWVSEVTSRQMKAGNEFLNNFGLNELYRTDGRVNQSGVEEYLRRPRNTHI